MNIKADYKPSGDNGILIVFSNQISEDINIKVRGFQQAIAENLNMHNEIIEVIPAYTSLLVIYDATKITFKKMVEKLRCIEEIVHSINLPPSEVVHIPVAYGGEFGPDLINVSNHNGISIDEVIELHSSVDYLIYMIGFTPGFPYLGGMKEKISTPRLKVPREKIEAGSVGIAGNQTGIYPIESPGGWQIIGRTPLKLFNPEEEPYVLLKAGQYIRFEAIDKNTFVNMQNEVNEGTYKVKYSLKGSV
ncbi:5-oxoprolinase subunit PxpB [Alkaliphilus pronyensis]|uniref:5-oxoprolinase subunit PxpB n=1 Tax=Alkaliphilus pronyensis TaxID=1482732 RepID=A0A6I0EX04_9FIRM|nr:5-oxoprolinase subunit PxpB [Alkaliphilus pronyensis]KAB3532760.1 5-oxoprolinase subunit PxpB [Alkaliphilus pronyensis]